uniref:Secreted protein n=1 Tax=Romanomermis culicivorax TaxID=13658 RepID=A0A915L303_ROMCU
MVVFVLASIAVGWTGVDLSMGTAVRVDISLSVSFKKLVICVAVALRWAVAVGIGRADTSVDGGSFAIFKSKISVSKGSLSAGSTLIAEVGRLSSSSVVSMCTEALVGKGYAYTSTVNENRF